MKLLKLTNAAKGRIGDALILNTEIILSFFEHTQEDGTKVKAAFGINNNFWEVAESPDEIMQQANT
jgi:hypothetical protein